MAILIPTAVPTAFALDEGYGLNDDAIGHIAEKGTVLVISVDSCITGHSSAQLAAEVNLDRAQAGR